VYSRRTEERIPTEQHCFRCGKDFIVYQNGPAHKVPRFDACSECAAKRAAIEYNIHVWDKH